MTISDDITLWTSKAMALACSIAAALYAAAELEPSSVVVLILTAGPLFTVILWLQKDAQRTCVTGVLDWGFFLWFAWPVVIPWYAWRTRGRAGWRLALGLIALILSPYVTGACVSWLIYGVRFAIYGLRYAIWYLETGG